MTGTELTTRLDAIEKEQAELRERLATAKGRVTEVYSRIVGYYRSVGAWNKGKREEFAERVTFGVPEL